MNGLPGIGADEGYGSSVAEGPGPLGAVPGYEDLTLVGSGGFSRVYRAYQRRFDRVVAVKILTAPVDDDLRRRFFQECALTGRLTGHPHVVTILDSGVTATGRPFLTTEYFEAGSLAGRVRAEGPLPFAEVLAIGVKIAGALETAHQAGVHHRDVKPPNILLSRFGEPALGDFGISTTVREPDEIYPAPGITMVHAPPEVLDGALGDATGDVYSLASTLYHALAGRSAFAEGDDGLADRVRSAPVPPIDRGDLPADVSAELAQAMAKRPDDRPASPLLLARRLQALERSAGLRPTPVVCTGAPPTPEKQGPDAPLVVEFDGDPGPLVGVATVVSDEDDTTDPRPRRPKA